MSEEITCRSCSGWGDAPDRDPCQKCGGRGYVVDRAVALELVTPAILDQADGLVAAIQDNVRLLMGSSCLGEGEVYYQEGVCVVRLYNWYPTAVLDQLKMQISDVVPRGTSVVVEC